MAANISLTTFQISRGFHVPVNVIGANISFSLSAAIQLTLSVRLPDLKASNLLPISQYPFLTEARTAIYALRVRRRIKEQLKKIGGMEFYDVHFSYIDRETLEEFFASVPEQGGSSLISEDILNPGHLYMVSEGDKNAIGLYKVELQTTPNTVRLIDSLVKIAP